MAMVPATVKHVNEVRECGGIRRRTLVDQNEKGCYSMSTLTASAKPTLAELKKEVGVYTTIMRSHALAIGDCWDDIHPMRKGSTFEQFRFWLDRFSKLLQLEPSEERELALVVVRDRLWGITCHMEDSHD